MRILRRVSTVLAGRFELASLRTVYVPSKYAKKAQTAELGKSTGIKPVGGGTDSVFYRRAAQAFCSLRVRAGRLTFG